VELLTRRPRGTQHNDFQHTGKSALKTRHTNTITRFICCYAECRYTECRGASMNGRPQTLLTNIRLGWKKWKWQTLVYYASSTITDLKSFIVLALIDLLGFWSAFPLSLLGRCRSSCLKKCFECKTTLAREKICT
jgi:hypothetical protein